MLSLAVSLPVCAAEGPARDTPRKSALGIGDSAPPIEAMAWIRGEPVSAYAPGHVYVVEFWATWCGPCIAAMPHLSELARKHAGRLTVVGVNVMESRTGHATVEAVTEFVRRKGADMDYTVAMDNPDTEAVFAAWMGASGIEGIPTSFVVDGEGRVVWLGHPMGRDMEAFDVAVAQALAGDSDLQAARALQALMNAQTEERARERSQLQPLRDAQARQDYPTIVVEARKLAALNPRRYRARMFGVELGALLHIDEQAAFKFAQGKADDGEFRQQLALSDDARYWGIVGDTIAAQDGLSDRAYTRAIHYLRDILSAEPNDDSRWRVLAELHRRLGDIDQAIEAQQQAIAAAMKDNTLPEQYVTELRDVLARYQAEQ